MEENNAKEKNSKPKNFLARMLDKLDKKMKEKADTAKSCCSSDKKGNSCCS